MKTCPSCGEKTDSKFCPECGMDLSNVEADKCPKCGSELEEDALFCPECGEEIDKAEGAEKDSCLQEENNEPLGAGNELVEANSDGIDSATDNANQDSNAVLITEAVESVERAEDDKNLMDNTDIPLDNSASSNGKKNKKTIGIIAGIVVLAAIIAFVGLGRPSEPKVDHYSINYYTPYDGDFTADIDDMDLIAVYDNEEEVTIDKSEWYISDPTVLTSPTTDITIRYNNEDLYFTINVNEAEPEPEPEPEPAKPEDMTVRDMMDSIEAYLDGLISQDKCEKYQESDNGKYIFINWPSGNKALVSGIVFNKYVGDEYVEVDSTDEKPDSMNVRTQETMIQGETGWFVKGQSAYAMEYMMKAILPSEFGDDDSLHDKLSEMQNDAGAQMTGDGSYAISEKEIGGYKVTLLLTQKDDKLDSVFSIKF